MRKLAINCVDCMFSLETLVLALDQATQFGLDSDFAPRDFDKL